MNVLTVVLFAGGGLLIYAGIKDKNPRDVIRDSLQTSKQPAPSAVQNEAFKPDGGMGSAARV